MLELGGKVTGKGYTMYKSMPLGREPTWEAFMDALKEEFYHVGSYDD
jgi:hypothetical protein